MARQPTRIVWSRSLDLPLQSVLATTAGEVPESTTQLSSENDDTFSPAAVPTVSEMSRQRARQIMTSGRRSGTVFRAIESNRSVACDRLVDCPHTWRHNMAANVLVLAAHRIVFRSGVVGSSLSSPLTTRRTAFRDLYDESVGTTLSLIARRSATCEESVESLRV